MQQGKPLIATLDSFGKDDTMNKDDLVNDALKHNPDVIVLQGDQAHFCDELGFGSLETIYEFSLNQLTGTIPTIVHCPNGRPRLR